MSANPASYRPAATSDIWVLSVPRVILGNVEVTEADIARIPRGNLRVPVTEFAQVWREAERLNRAENTWYTAALVITCRWIATATVRPEDGSRWYPARSPVTKSTRRAYEELIQAECIAADRLDMRRPRPASLLSKPGWSEGISTMLHWAWLRDRPAPVDVEHSVIR